MNFKSFWAGWFWCWFLLTMLVIGPADLAANLCSWLGDGCRAYLPPGSIPAWTQPVLLLLYAITLTISARRAQPTGLTHF